MKVRRLLTGQVASLGSISKLRAIIAIAVLDSRNARLRPGQKRGPAPKARNDFWIGCRRSRRRRKASGRGRSRSRLAARLQAGVAGYQQQAGARGDGVPAIVVSASGSTPSIGRPASGASTPAAPPRRSPARRPSRRRRGSARRPAPRSASCAHRAGPPAAREEPQRPGHRVRGRVLAGEQQREHVADDFLVGERSVGLLRGEHSLEEVLGRLAQLRPGVHPRRGPVR